MGIKMFKFAMCLCVNVKMDNVMSINARALVFESCVVNCYLCWTQEELIEY